jgi:hypothetical protein
LHSAGIAATKGIQHILRAHRLIARIPKTHRYQVTEHGRLAITGLLTARQADVKSVLKAA